MDLEEVRLLTIEQIETGILTPAKHWKGRCHEISWCIRARFDIKCRLCYGHWWGPIAPGSFFRNRRGQPFQRHGWLELADETIIDPTRWVFEDVKPYIFFAKNDGLYDEGGERLRVYLERTRPIPKQGAHPTKVALKILPEDQETRVFIEAIFEQPPEELNFMQAMYLANMSRYSLGKHARPIFQAIVDANQGILIPVDNRLKVLGENSHSS